MPRKNKSKSPTTQERSRTNVDSRSNRKRSNKSNVDESNTRNMANHSGINDISWYTKYPNIVSAAARFPYPYRPGMDIGFGMSTATTAATTVPVITSGEFIYNIPGVMVMDWVPTVGNSKRATDPASVVAKELYSKVRSKFSGSLDADAPDFMTYVMAMDSIYAYIAYLKRMYRCISAFSPENYATPYQVLRSMGLTNETIEELRNNKTRFYAIINELVLQSRKFTVPVGMDIFNRHYWMSDNVYTDTNSIRGQFYLFNMKAAFKYEFDTESERPILKLHHLPQFGGQTAVNNVTVEQWFEFGLDMIDRLVAWDDAYTINGYLMRAFEGTPGFMVEELVEHELINFVYEPEVLMQIENSHCVPFGSAIEFDGNNEVFAITQDVMTNSVVSDLTYVIPTTSDYFRTLDTDVLIPTGIVSMAPVLNIRADNPAEGDNIIASRLQGHTTVAVSGSNYVFSVTAGTEIPLCWRTITGDEVGSEVMTAALDSQDIVSFDTLSPSVTVNAANMMGSLADARKALDMEAFGWHPLVRSVVLRVASSSASFKKKMYICADVNNITTITRESLRELHKICLYSELNAFSV